MPIGHACRLIIMVSGDDSSTSQPGILGNLHQSFSRIHTNYEFCTPFSDRLLPYILTDSPWKSYKDRQWKFTMFQEMQCHTIYYSRLQHTQMRDLYHEWIVHSFVILSTTPYSSRVLLGISYWNPGRLQTTIIYTHLLLKFGFRQQIICSDDKCIG